MHDTVVIELAAAMMELYFFYNILIENSFFLRYCSFSSLDIRFTHLVDGSIQYITYTHFAIFALEFHVEKMFCFFFFFFFFS